jgi:hypothetical protein
VGFRVPAGEVCITMLQAVLIRCGSGPRAVFGRLTSARDEVNRSFRSSDEASLDVNGMPGLPDLASKHLLFRESCSVGGP